ncbi:hypothetical protein [Pseudooceanicola algae]|uniref:Uncharacterized protein n=1 Tax=Pseudooceanicola algae TaxID=1537215 RepID=A0A418SKB0_9RHOB|nr:hypothetical protein [Pseudooceanicola algae]QPM89156.1 hypothetical protein PSAL_003670 [Pseudooceanicola algae]
MTATRPPQVAFSSGELDPLLHAREDFQRHQTGLALCRGFLPLRQGGVTRAPGTIFRGYTRANAMARRIPFVFAEDDACSLEFSSGKMRVWRYGALVTEAGGGIYEIDTPFLEADLPGLNYLQDADVMYLSDGRNPMQQLSRFALNDWTITSAELLSGPFRVQNLDENLKLTLTPSGAPSDVAYWISKADLSINALRKYGTRIYRFKGEGPSLISTTNGSCGELPPTHDNGTESYLVDDFVDPDIFAFWEFVYDTESTAGGFPIDIEADSDLFTEDHVDMLMMIEPTDWSSIAIWVGNASVGNGQLVRYAGNIYAVIGTETGVNPPVHSTGTVRTDASKGTKYRHVSTEVGIVRIRAVTDATHAVADVLQAVPQPCLDDPTYRWSMGAWNDLFGHPRFLTLFGQRLYTARTATEPRTVSASTVGAYRDFLPGAEADASFSYDIGGITSKNPITWLTAGRRGVYIGSMGGVRLVIGTADSPITLTTFNPEIVSTDGAAAIQPVMPYGWPVYVTRDKGRLMEVRYNFSDDAMRPFEISLPSQHLGAELFEQIVWQPSPYQRGWIRRGDGTLLCLIYDPEQDVLGWATVPMAGGVVEDLEVSPSVDSAFDVLSMIVRREIDGQTVRCIEEQAINLRPSLGSLGEEHFNHAFCGSVFAPEAPADTFYLPHLTGETVAAWTDKGPYSGLVVGPGGAVVLPDPVSHAVIGLADATHQFRTLPIRAAANDGDARGRKRRLKNGSAAAVFKTVRGFARCVERIEGEAEYVSPPVELVPLHVASDDVTGRTGILSVELTSGEADEVMLQFEPDGLAPMTITGIFPNIEEVGA